MEFATALINMACVLLKPIAGKIDNLVSMDTSVSSLTNKMEELKDTRDDVKRRVDEAELRLLTCPQQVKGWLQRVEHVENDVNLIVEESNGKRRKRCFGICCVKYCTTSYYRLGKKVAEKLKEVEELKSQGVFDTVVDDVLTTPPIVIPMPSTSSAVGVDAMLEKVRRCLREEDDVGIIGLYGMGGVGKTTILRKINNEFISGAHDFDVVIWALVSKDFALEKIQNAVCERLGLDWIESDGMDQRAKIIFNVLRKKRFVLLLDDVWERVDLERIGIPIPDTKNKCKVLFTTRDLHVSRSMDAQNNLKVEFLNEEQAWQLFRNKVGNNAIVDSLSVRSMTEIIIKKCGGLPLALVTVGRAMANKETVEEWKDAIRVLNKSPSELRGMEKDVFSLLKFSYDNLQDDTLRSCFLYCALFPEDYSIEKEQLIEYWIDEGLLEAFDDHDARYKGHALIGALKVSCLLEDGEEDAQVKMHDVIRGTALWIASECGKKSNKFLVEASIGLTAAPKAEKWKGAEKVSLMDNNISMLTEIPICHDLQTLMLQWNTSLNKITHGFFQFMPSLRVLDLSFTSIKELPVSIGGLVELRRLDLSATKLTTLPSEIGSLANLRHLDLERTKYLQQIPSKAITKLRQLKLLNLYYSYPNWEEEEGYEDEKSICFDDLEGLSCLNSLGITITAVSKLFQLACLNNLPKCIQYLYITKCEGLTRFQPSSASGRAVRIRRLSIYSCDELEELVIGKEAGKNWLPSLEFLSLHSLPSLTTIWRRPVTPGCLQNLRFITVWRCDKLKNLTWVLHLRSLEVLYIFECKDIEEVISGSQVGEEVIAFPNLRKLSIQNLPKLRIIHQHKLAFPSLNTFAVIKCPELKRLPFKAPHGTKMPPIIYGTREWWDGLEWEEDDKKVMFDSYFIAS